MQRFVVEIPDEYVSDDGEDLLDVVTNALDHFFIPAYIYPVDND